ncbi:uncharacterized protein [Drosophila takahashii]|uniref:uncharacterized protein n=1 Tax=Drosophila takahashii TaxID=29030 RepID=UPI0038993ACE
MSEASATGGTPDENEEKIENVDTRNLDTVAGDPTSDPRQFENNSMLDLWRQMQEFQQQSQENGTIEDLQQQVERQDQQCVGAQEPHRSLYDLPEFDGSPEQWPMFNEAFLMTTKEYGYSDRQNLLRLQKALKGRARETVECLLIYSSNVGNILGTLKQNFGRPEKLVKSEICRIRELPNFPFLQATDAQQQLKNPTLMEELVLKLPVQQRLEWARYSKQLGDIAGLADDQDTPKPRRENRFFHTSEIKGKECPAYKENHEIDVCDLFSQMELPQRWQLTRDGRLCFNCLRPGHRSSTCRTPHQCDLNGCRRRLHKLLHDGVRTPDNETRINDPQFTGAAAHIANPKILFKIIPVRLYSKGREVSCHAFLDEGSTVTLMNESVAKALELQGQVSSRFNIGISGDRERGIYNLNGVRTVKDLRLPKQSVDLSELHLKNIPLMPHETVLAEGTGPAVTRTKLGWVVFGKCLKEPDPKNGAHLAGHCRNDQLEKLVHDYITNSELDARQATKHLEGQETERSRHLLFNTTRRVGVRFETGLLWAADDVVLPESKNMALRAAFSSPCQSP